MRNQWAVRFPHGEPKLVRWRMEERRTAARLLFQANRPDRGILQAAFVMHYFLLILLSFFVIMCLNEYAVVFHRLDITATFPSQATNASLMPANDRKSSNNQTGFRGPDLGVQQDHPAMDSLQDKKSLIQKEPEKNTSETTQRSRTNRIRRGILAGPVPQVLKLLCLKTHVIACSSAVNPSLSPSRNQTENVTVERCPSRYSEEKRKPDPLRMDVWWLEVYKAAEVKSAQLTVYERGARRCAFHREHRVKTALSEWDWTWWRQQSKIALSCLTPHNK